MKMSKEIVDFHGEMVLLENFTGLVKILKKYDKRTGGLLQLPFTQKVLQQLFFNTNLLYELVKDYEVMLDRLFPIYEPSISGREDRDGEGDIEHKFLKHGPLWVDVGLESKRKFSTWKACI